MTEAQRLAHPDVPGATVRASLIQQGIDAERERLLAYLLEQGIVRESMLGAYAATTFNETTDGWHVIDLPKDLNAWQPKGKK